MEDLINFKFALMEEHLMNTLFGVNFLKKV